MITVRRRLNEDQEGASAVELAALLPVAMLLIYGGIELARYQYLYSGIQSASSASIRHATNQRSVDPAALKDAFFSSLGVHSPELITELSFSTTPHSLASVERLEVVVNYRFDPVADIIFPAPLDLQSSAKGLVPVSE